jgi:hypothetical protein
MDEIDSMELALKNAPPLSVNAVSQTSDFVSFYLPISVWGMEATVKGKPESLWVGITLGWNHSGLGSQGLR